MPDEVIALGISEPERRWPEFAGGMAIVLPDGQAWHFYEPEVRVGERGPGWAFGGPPEENEILSDRFRRILAKGFRASSEAELASATLEAAWFLLGRNYRITPEEFGQLVGQPSGLEGEAEEVYQQALGMTLQLLVMTTMAKAAAFADAERGEA